MKSIGEVSNYYGGLHVQEVAGKYYWTIEDFDGLSSNLVDGDGTSPWEEIPKLLYEELIRFADA